MSKSQIKKSSFNIARANVDAERAAELARAGEAAAPPKEPLEAKSAEQIPPAFVIVEPEPQVNVDSPAKEPTAVAVPTQEELLSILKSLQSMVLTQTQEIAALKAAAPQRVTYEEDLTDELLFLARPNGEHWEDRIVVDNKTVRIEGYRTAFFGPFDSEGDVTKYLTEKLRKRPDAASEWADVKSVKGHEARRLRADERQEIQRRHPGQAAVNILDRRMRPALDSLTGAMDRVPGVGVAIAPREHG